MNPNGFVPPDFQLLLEGSPGLVIVFDTQYRIVAQTDAHAQSIGAKREDLLGRNVFEAFPDNPDDPNADGQAKLKASLDRAIQTKSPDAMPIQKYDIPQEDGSFDERYWNIVNTPILNKNGEVLYISSGAEDCTAYMKMKKESERISGELQEKNEKMELELFQRAKELEEINEQLRRSKTELELSNSYKSDFLSNMSHELRTPLNSMLILSHLLQENHEGNLSKKQVEQISVINKAGKDLLSLINDILDLSKIESGKMEINPEPVALDTIRGDLQSLFQPIASQKNILFETDIDAGLPKLIQTDVQRLEQVLRNLLSNAFKFTAEGGSVHFAVHPASRGQAYKEPALQQAKEVIAFSVSDTGIGIPAEKQMDIFSAFRQADTSISRKYGGTGLGLSISRQLTALLNGEIVLQSEVGRGSVFTVFLPVN